MGEADGFFSRWSRRKVAARQGEALVEPTVPVPTSGAAAAPVVVAPQGIEPTAAEPEPTLDDVAALETGAEVARFVAPGVARQVKNAALKKLFADPHFNVMDGLDVYIEDFGRPDPLPPEMLQSMLDSPSFRFLAPPPEQQEAREVQEPEKQLPEASIPEPLAAPLPAAALPPCHDCPDGPDEDPDLRLQPIDAVDAGPAGPGAPGPGGDAGRLA